MPYTSGELYALRVQNGQVAWSDVLSHSGQVTALSELDDIAGRPVIDRDKVYRHQPFRRDGGDQPLHRRPAVVARYRRHQDALAAGDYVYVLTGDGQVLCLTRKEGKVRWVHQLPQFERRRQQDPPDRLDRAGAGVRQADRDCRPTAIAEAISPYTGQLLGRVEMAGGTIIAPGGGRRHGLYLYR